MQKIACNVIVPQLAATNSLVSYFLYRTEKIYPPYKTNSARGINKRSLPTLLANMYVEYTANRSIRR